MANKTVVLSRVEIDNRDADFDSWDEEYELEFESDYKEKSNHEFYWSEMSYHRWN